MNRQLKSLEKIFDFIEEIGSGRLGKVYKVKNLATGKILALKINLAAENDVARTEQGKDLLINEYKILSHLHHANIVDVDSVGFTPEGIPYFLMEYISGAPIREHFKKLRSDLGLFNQIVQQICDALDYIHSQGIVHGDLKPENILVAENKKQLTVKLSDFGLAEIYRGSVKDSGLPLLKGTYQYMSPELISGRKTDHRTDLYALGVILYEIITGQNPFSYESVHSIISAHLNKHPTAPIELNPDTPASLNDIIMQLLAKEPSFRPSTAQEVAVALHLKSGEYLSPPPLTGGMFVGQHLPWKELQRALESTCQGKGMISIISGETGIGKSRFLSEVKVDFQLAGAHIIEVVMSPETQSSYDILSDVFKHLNRFNPAFSPGLLKLIYQEARDDQVSVSTDLRSTRMVFGQAAQMFLQQMKTPDGEIAEMPVVIILKEFHTDEIYPWMFFKELAVKWDELCPDNLSCLWLIESRSENARNLFSSAIPPRFLPVELVSLTEDETGILLGSLLSVTPFPQELTQKIHSISHGNPLLINQLAFALHRNGVSIWKDYGWRIDMSKVETLELTSELTKLSKVQLQHLNYSQKTLLQHASLWPRAFQVRELLFTLPSDTDYSDIIPILVLQGYINREISNQTVNYRISHPSLHTLLHDSIPAYEQVNLHLKIAGELIKNDQASKSDVAYHLLAGDNRIDGCEYAAQAAREFASQGKHQLACYWYKTAIEKMPDRNRSKIAQLSYEMAQSKFALFEYKEVIQLLEDAESVLDSRFYQKREKAQFLHLKGATLFRLLRPYDAVKALEESLEYLPKTTGMDLRLRILTTYATALIPVHRMKKAVEIIEENLTLLPLNEYPQLAGLLLVTLARAYFLMKNLPEAESAQKRAIEFGEMASSPVSIIDRYIKLGLIYHNMGRYREALQEYEKVISLSRKISDFDNLAYSLSLYASLKMELDQDSATETYFHESLEIAERTGNPEILIAVLQSMGSFMMKQGKIERAKDFLNRAMDYSSPGVDQVMIANVFKMLSRIEILQGNWSMAIKYCEMDLEITRKLRDFVNIEVGYLTMAIAFKFMKNWQKALLYLNRAKRIARFAKVERPDPSALEAEIYFLMDDIESALEKCKTGLASPRARAYPSEIGDLHRVLGQVYHKQGYFDKSRNHFLSALNEHEAAHNIYDLAIARFHLADMYISASELEKARTEFTQAREIFKRFGAEHYVEEIDKTVDNLDRPKDLHSIDTDPILPVFEQITGLINSITDTDDLLEKILDCAIRHVHAERGVVILANPESSEFEIKAVRNLDAATSKDACQISRTILTEITITDSSVLTGDAPSDPRFSTIKSVKAYNILSLICVPLRIQKKSIGAIYVDSRRIANLFSEKDRRFLQTFADLAAITIERSQLYRQQVEEKAFLQKQIEDHYHFDHLIGRSKVMQEVFHQLSCIARTDTSVLITGQTGTGKELAARAIHYNSYRHNRKFVAVNCAAIPGNLLESELFGYVKGAFTDARQDRPGRFEFAEGGTLFLDEISELPTSLQAKLLRVIETKELNRLGEDKARPIDVRIIAATNRDLRAEIQAGNFREDIYYRLRVAHIRMPELKDHMDDLPLLSEHFLIQACKRTGRHFTEIDSKALEALSAYSWPGNVRELENAIESAIVFGTPPIIHLKDLPQEIRVPFAKSGAAFGKPELRSLEEVEEAHIRSILAYTGGNKLRACQILGISRPTLDRKLDEYNISAKKFKHDS